MAAAEDLVPLIEEDAAEAERIFRQTDRVVAALRKTGIYASCCRALWVAPSWPSPKPCAMRDDTEQHGPAGRQQDRVIMGSFSPRTRTAKRMVPLPPVADPGV
jgi:hypothetical protein